MNKIAKLLLGLNRGPLSQSYLFGWGTNTNGGALDPFTSQSTTLTRLTQLSSLNQFGLQESWVQVSTGDYHTLAIKDDGSMWAWGNNANGRLGLNLASNTSVSSPRKVGSAKWLQVRAGGEHSIAIREDGTVWAWGRNDAGQLGDGTTINRSSPVQLAGSWSSVRPSAYTGKHTVGIKSDGTLWAWGDNSTGQLAQGNLTNYSSPVQIGTDTWKYVSGGSGSVSGAAVVGIKSDDTIWGWGYNNNYELGTTVLSTAVTSPIQLVTANGTNTTTTFKAVEHAGATGLAIDTTGKLWGMGPDTLNNSILGGTVPYVYPPKMVSSAANLVSLTARNSSYLALDNDKKLWGGGRSAEYQVLYSGGDAKWSKFAIAGGFWPGTTSISSTVIATKEDKSILMWGLDPIGNTTFGYSYAKPTTIPGIYNTQLDANVSFVMVDAGSTWVSCAWDGSTNSGYWFARSNANNKPAYAGPTTATWVGGIDAGFGDYNVTRPRSSSANTQLYAVANPTGILQYANAELFRVSANASVGNNHLMYKHSNGIMYTVGTNYYGELGYSTGSVVGSNNWTSISTTKTGLAHNVVYGIKGDGKMYTWGKAPTKTRFVNGAFANSTAYTTTGVTNVGAHSMFGISGANAPTQWGNNYKQYNWANGTYTVTAYAEVVSPTQIGSGVSWSMVNSGVNHAVAIDTSYRLYGWGNNAFNQAGSASSLDVSVPTQIGTANTWALADAGNNFSIAVNTSGKVYGWGSANSGTLLSQATLPGNWKTVAIGRAHTLAISNTGGLYAWGNNEFSQLGVTGITYSSTPIKIDDSQTWATIDASNNASIAVTQNGQAYIWGRWGGTTYATPTGASPQGSYGNVDITIASNTTAAWAVGYPGQRAEYGYAGFGAISNSSLSDVTVNGGYFSGNGMVPLSYPSTSWKMIDAGVAYTILPSTGSYDFPGTTVLGIRTEPGQDAGTLWAWGYDGGRTRMNANSTVFFMSSPVQIGTANNWKYVARTTESYQTIGYAVDTGGNTYAIYANINLSNSSYTSYPYRTNSFDVDSTPTWSTTSNTLDASFSSLMIVAANGAALGRGSMVLDRPYYYNTNPVATMPSTGSIQFKKLVNGLNHVVGVSVDGGLYSWGHANHSVNNLGISGTNRTANLGSYAPPANTSWTSMSVTDKLGLAITSEGRLYAWGDNAYGQLGTLEGRRRWIGYPKRVTGGPASWSQVLSTGNAGYGIGTDGTLWAWGTGQLVSSKSSPVQIGTANTWSAIVGDTQNLYALNSIGELYATGYNFYGQLGQSLSNTELNYTSSLTQVAGSWKNVTSGNGFVIGIKSNNTLWGWGRNTNDSFTGINYGGCVGDNTASNRSSPVQIGTSSSWTMISSGPNHTLGTIWNGTQHVPYGWGRNDNGQLGTLTARANTNAGISAPTAIVGYTGGAVKQLLAGFYHSAILTTSNTYYSVGLNNIFPGGNIITSGNYDTPSNTATTVSWTLLNGYSNIKSLPTTGRTRMGYLLQNDGTLYTWGTKGYVTGFTDLNGYTSSDSVYNCLTTLAGVEKYYPAEWGESLCVINEPILISNSSWSDAVAGVYDVYALKTDGSLWSWGTGGYLGDGTSTGKSTPTRIGGTNTFTTVTTTTGYWNSNGAYISPQAAAITTDGKMYVWNYYDYSNTKITSLDPILVGSGISNASSSKFIACVNYGGIQQYPGVVAISNTSLTLSRFNHLTNVVLYINTTAPNKTTFEILDDYPYNPSLKNNRAVTNAAAGRINSALGFTDVTVGVDHMVVIRTDGTMWTWGNNSVGQLGIGTVPAANDLNTPILSPVQVGSANNWASVRAGYQYTLAVKTDGTMWGWGFDRQALMGRGNSATAYYSSPVQIGSANTWKSVFVYNTNTFNANDSTVSYALTTTDELYATGNGWFGDENTAIFQTSNTFTLVDQVVLPTITEPKSLASSMTFQTASSKMAVGLHHVVAIDSTNKIWAWGQNDKGQLGNDSTLSALNAPVQIGSSSWSMVAAGYRNTAAIKPDNTLWVWGDNLSGQCGNNSRALGKSSPVQVMSMANVGLFGYSNNIANVYVDVRVGEDYILAKRSGVNFTANTSASYATFNLTFGTTPDASVIAGIGAYANSTNVAVTVVDSVIGNTTFHITGNNGLFGTLWNSATWTTTEHISATNITAIEIGGVVYPALINDWVAVGKVPGVGFRSRPVQVGTTYTKMWPTSDLQDAGTYTNATPGSYPDIYTPAINNRSTGLYGVDANTQLWAYGYAATAHDQEPTYTSSFTLVDGGYMSPTSSPTQVGSTGMWSNTFSAGLQYSLSIGADGSLWAWGRNDKGQLGDGTTAHRSSPVQIGLESWTAVAAGLESSLAIHVDGTLWAWGGNQWGQLGTNDKNGRSSPVQVSTLTNWIDIQKPRVIAGGLTSAGVDDEAQTLYLWGGDNLDGSMGSNSTTPQLTPQPVPVFQVTPTITTMSKVSNAQWDSVSMGGDFALGVKKVT